MKGIAIGFLMLFLSTFGIAQNFKKINTEERIYGLSKFWQEVNYNFVYFENSPGLDFDALYKLYLTKVINAKNDYEYYRVLKQFCAYLKDGHTNVMYPKYINDALYYPRIKTERFGDKIYIINIGKSYENKIPKGSEIIKINGINVLEYLNSEVYPYISGPEHTVKNQGAKKMLIGLTGSKLLLEIKTPGGKKQKVKVLINGKHESWVYPEIKKSEEIMSFKNLTNEIGYLEIKTFEYSPKLEQKFKEILPKLYGVKKLIIDIRRNGGGSSAVGNELVKYLTDKPYFYGGQGSTRKHLASHKAWGQFGDSTATKKMGTKPTPYFKKYIDYYYNRVWEMEPKNKIINDVKVPKLLYPLVVLTSNSTASAAEDFLISLDGADRNVTIIGQKTFGSTGQPLFFELPKGGYFRVCTRKTTYSDGRKYVGVGVVPNIEVISSLSDFINNKDVVLEKAINYLKQN